MGTDCTKTTLCLCDECVEIEVETEPFGVNEFRHGKPSSSSWGGGTLPWRRSSVEGKPKEGIMSK